MLLLLGNLGWPLGNKCLVIYRSLLGNSGSGSYHYWRLWYRISGRNNGWTSYNRLLLLLSLLRLLLLYYSVVLGLLRLLLGRSCLLDLALIIID